VSDSSLTPTYAAAVLFIDSPRWSGIPFILKCGKALNEQKTEIRIQFRDAQSTLFPASTIARNELVIRVQPNESVYLKFMVKKPGFESEPMIADLDLTYNHRFGPLRIPDAYESLLLDVLRGDQSNFVRNDELLASWKIFSPVLHAIEKTQVVPDTYEMGSRGPESALKLSLQFGYERSSMEYNWKPYPTQPTP